VVSPILRPALVLALLLACDSRTPAPPAAAPIVTVPAQPVPATQPAPVAAPPVVASEPEAMPLPVPPAPPPDDRTPRFAAACDVGDTVTIGAVGDLLLHHELQIQAYAAPDNFLAVWGGVKDLLARADISYANLEGTTAAGIHVKGHEVDDPGRVFDRKVYTSYPRFNYHPMLLDDLVASGIDVVSTANNHSLDRGPLGVDRTLAALDRIGLAHTGTRARAATGPWHAITENRGIRVAWLACAHHTNQTPDPDAQVLRCYEPEGALEALVTALVADPAIDAVIVTPHWGKEYQPQPEKAQRNLAARLAKLGVTAVIGSHPHVLQPWEVLAGPGGHEMLVMYSLGNFASHQPELPRRSSMVLYLGLTRPPGKKARVHGVRYVPLHVRQDGERYFVEAIDRVGGPADSRAHTVRVFGEAAVIAPDGPLATRQACP
jgi:hypothetical protein